jgi:hypothetical protein
MTTFHKDTVWSIRVPPLPSARLPCDTTRWAIRGWPVHYSRAHYLTTTIIELCRFTEPHKSDMRLVHNEMLVQVSTTNGPQSTQARDTTLEPQISTYHSLSFSSDDTLLSPSCPTRSQI